MVFYTQFPDTLKLDYTHLLLSLLVAVIELSTIEVDQVCCPYIGYMYLFIKTNWSYFVIRLQLASSGPENIYI